MVDRAFRLHVLYTFHHSEITISHRFLFAGVKRPLGMAPSYHRRRFLRHALLCLFWAVATTAGGGSESKPRGGV